MPTDTKTPEPAKTEPKAKGPKLRPFKSDGKHVALSHKDDVESIEAPEAEEVIVSHLPNLKTITAPRARLVKATQCGNLETVIAVKAQAVDTRGSGPAFDPKIVAAEGCNIDRGTM